MKFVLFLNLFLFSFLFLLKISNKTKTYFSPDNRPAEKLIKSIDGAKERIHAAVFMITNDKIIDALIRAKNKAVDVQIITDSGNLAFQKNKVKKILQSKIPIFVYKTNTQNKNYFSARMHNKFAVIDNWVWTGSFNWTYYADAKNQENVVLMNKPKVISKYEKQFEIIKKERTYTLTVETLEQLVIFQNQKRTENKSTQVVRPKISNGNGLRSKVVDLLKLIRFQAKNTKT